MNTETENRGKSTIKYRWEGICDSWNEGPAVRNFFVFSLKILAFLIILFPALIFWPCELLENFFKDDMRNVWGHLNTKSDSHDDGKDTLPEFLADIMVLVLFVCLWLVLRVVELPFLMLCELYKSINQCLKERFVKILVLLAVLGGIAFYVFRYVSHRVEQGHVDATTEMAR